MFQPWLTGFVVVIVIYNKIFCIKQQSFDFGHTKCNITSQHLSQLKSVFPILLVDRGTPSGNFQQIHRQVSCHFCRLWRQHREFKQQERCPVINHLKEQLRKLLKVLCAPNRGTYDNS